MYKKKAYFKKLFIVRTMNMKKDTLTTQHVLEKIMKFQIKPNPDDSTVTVVTDPQTRLQHLVSAHVSRPFEWPRSENGGYPSCPSNITGQNTRQRSRPTYGPLIDLETQFRQGVVPGSNLPNAPPDNVYEPWDAACYLKTQNVETNAFYADMAQQQLSRQDKAMMNIGGGAQFHGIVTNGGDSYKPKQQPEWMNVASTDIPGGRGVLVYPSFTMETPMIATRAVKHAVEPNGYRFVELYLADAAKKENNDRMQFLKSQLH